MQFTFDYPTRFEDGQAISAYDINKYRTNNALIRKLLYSPQQLPMDSNIYSPKATPIHSIALPKKTEDVVWKGSFLYRSGMKKAYLGMSISIENAVTPAANTAALPATIFKNDKLKGNAGLAIILKHTEFTYKEIQAKPAYASYWDAVNILSSIEANATIDNGKGIYFNVKYGKADASHTFPGTSWATIDGSKRITTIEIDLEGYNRVFQDGEIVQISIILLPNKDNTDVSFGAINIGDSVAKYNSFPYIKHMMLYAETDGDLSYSTNWSDIPAVTTTGNNVLSKTNLNAISDKQTYLIERLSNRPNILTGSVMYFSVWAGTYAQRYLSQDLSESNEKIYFPESDTGGKTADANRISITNAEASLGTFAWNPYLDTYPQLLINYKFYGNTAPQQFMIVDIPNGPTTLPTVRQTDRDPANANNLFGSSRYIGDPFGATPEPVSWAYSANFVKNLYQSFYSTSTTSNPRYKLFPFQIRIPSYSTPVFKLEDNEYKSDIFFRKGFYQDSTAITFSAGDTSNNYKQWKLPKAYDETTGNTYTSQIGFVAEIPESGVAGLLKNNQPEYRQVSTYNNYDWSWISKVNEPAGHRPVFINLYDHSSINVFGKANYISFMHLIGVSAFNSANINYTVDTDLEGNTTTTYSGLRTTISGINSTLDSFYTNLFDKNPHFNRYQMFWGAPQSFVNDQKVIQEYNKKFFMFTQCRRGDILIVRGKNVTLSYGELTEITRDGNPAGSFMQVGDVNVAFEKTQGLINGSTEQTIIFNLSNADGLAYGQQYYLTGDVIYAAEFFEEPS